MNRNFLKLFLIVFFFLGGIIFFSFCVHAAGPYDYTSLAPIPGSQDSGSNLAAYLQAIYKFAIWTVGIAAILMITIGGFMYLVSAGNTSKMDTAKRVVTDAVIGLIVALSAYLLLYVINPDLVKIDIVLKPLGSGMSTSQTQPTTSGSGGSGSGKCQPQTSGGCAVSKFKGACGWDPEKASAICFKENGGKETPSTTDICLDKNPFSVGLFQINLTCRVEDADCKKAFELGTKCTNFKCVVKDTVAYQACVNKYSNSANNTKEACKLYNTSNGWNHWSVNKEPSGCGFTK